MTLEELQNVATGGGMPKVVGKQLADWIYGKKVVSFDEMVNISVKNRAWLADNFEIGRHAPTEMAESRDGTRKYLFVFKPDGGHNAEVRALFVAYQGLFCPARALFVIGEGVYLHIGKPACNKRAPARSVAVDYQGASARLGKRKPDSETAGRNTDPAL